MNRCLSFRLSYIAAAALIAAALGDFVVEFISNSGILGARYDDENHLSVVPTLVAGLVLVLEIHGARRLGQNWLVEVATRVAERPSVRDLPYVLALQLCALFAMESIEQLAFGGHLLGGAIWLGGPVLFSLLVHAALGAACTFVLGSLMRAVLRTVASLIETAIALVWFVTARSTGGSFFTKRTSAPCLRAQAPHVRQIGGRAPPLLRTPALAT